MRLYPKRLKGLDDLKREKEMLSYMKKQTEAEDFFPKVNLGFGGKSSKGIFSMISSLLSSGSGLEKGMAIAEPLIGILRKRRKKKKAKAKEEYTAPKEPRKNVVKSLLISILTGYLKWKAIEMGTKLIISFIKPKKKEDKGSSSRH